MRATINENDWWPVSGEEKEIEPAAQGSWHGALRKQNDG
jgi:hypothetical protein